MKIENDNTQCLKMPSASTTSMTSLLTVIGLALYLSVFSAYALRHYCYSALLPLVAYMENVRNGGATGNSNGENIICAAKESLSLSSPLSYPFSWVLQRQRSFE